MATFLPARSVRAYSDRVALVEREHLLETLTGLHDDALAGSGRLVLVHGEAGVGKSALVRAWSAARGSARPCALGCVRPAVVPAAARSARRPRAAPRSTGRGAAALGRARRPVRGGHRSPSAQRPTVVVIEDLQWADMSTLDLVRFLARRLEATNTAGGGDLPRRSPAAVRPAARHARRHRLAAGRAPPRGAAAVGGRGRRARRRLRHRRGGALPRDRRQRVLRHRGRGLGRPAAARDRAGRRAGSRSPGSRRRRGSRWSPRPSSARGSSPRSCTPCPTCPPTPSTSASAPGCCASRHRRTPSGTSWSASPCSPASRRDGSAPCTGRCSTGCAPCRCLRARSRGSPSMPRWPATVRRSSSSPSPPAIPPPASDRTVRRRSSTAAPCPTPTCSTPTSAIELLGKRAQRVRDRRPARARDRRLGTSQIELLRGTRPRPRDRRRAPGPRRARTTRSATTATAPRSSTRRSRCSRAPAPAPSSPCTLDAPRRTSCFGRGVRRAPSRGCERALELADARRGDTCCHRPSTSLGVAHFLLGDHEAGRRR